MLFKEKKIVFCLIFCLLNGGVFASDLPKIFAFNHKNSLKEWKEKIFRNRVTYDIYLGEEKGCLIGESNSACSALFYRINFNPRIFPYISWKWKVARFPFKKAYINLTKEGWIENDDYAARIYVIFPSLIFTHTECIEYVWAEDITKGVVLTNPFFKNIKQIVIESGRESFNKWVIAERNIVSDYKLAFGRDLKRNVGAIAIMTDADNTQSSAIGYYSDIKIGYGRPIFGTTTQNKEEKSVQRGLWENINGLINSAKVRIKSVVQ